MAPNEISKFQEPFRFVYHISRFVGAYFLDSDFNISKKWLWYSSTILLVHVICRVHSIFYPMKMPNLFYILYKMHHTSFETAIAIINVLGPLYKSDKLKSALRDISIFKTNNKFALREICCTLFLLYTAHLIIHLIFTLFTLLQFTSEVAHIRDTVLFFLSFIHFTCVILHYSFILSHTSSLFEAASNYEMIEESILIYDTLTSSIVQIQSYYDLHLAYIMSWSFGVIIMHVYLLANDPHSAYVFVLLLWLPAFILDIYLIIHPLRKICEEVNYMMY